MYNPLINRSYHPRLFKFRSPEEANLGFVLNGVNVMGKPLKVGRPKTYQGLMTMGDDNLLSNTIASVLINGIMNTPIKGEKILFVVKCYVLKKFRKILN